MPLAEYNPTAIRLPANAWYLVASRLRTMPGARQVEGYAMRETLETAGAYPANLAPFALPIGPGVPDYAAEVLAELGLASVPEVFGTPPEWNRLFAARNAVDDFTYAVGEPAENGDDSGERDDLSGEIREAIHLGAKVSSEPCAETRYAAEVAGLTRRREILIRSPFCFSLATWHAICVAAGSDAYDMARREGREYNSLVYTIEGLAGELDYCVGNTAVESSSDAENENYYKAPFALAIQRGDLPAYNKAIDTLGLPRDLSGKGRAWNARFDAVRDAVDSTFEFCAEVNAENGDSEADTARLEAVDHRKPWRSPDAWVALAEGPVEKISESRGGMPVELCVAVGEVFDADSYNAVIKAALARPAVATAEEARVARAVANATYEALRGAQVAEQGVPEAREAYEAAEKLALEAEAQVEANAAAEAESEAESESTEPPASLAAKLAHARLRRAIAERAVEAIDENLPGTTTHAEEMTSLAIEAEGEAKEAAGE